MRSPAPDYARQLSPYIYYERKAFVRGKLHRLKLWVHKSCETNADTVNRPYYMEHTEYTLAEHEAAP